MRNSAITVELLIARSAELLEASGLCFGHGSDNAFDEAAELIFFATDLKHEDASHVYSQVLTAEQQSRATNLIQQRIRERVPAAYLTNRMWFCGHEFYVDKRVLVPRSPLAELIAARFGPWLDGESIKHVLDIGTGSGCIAVATALALEGASVDATDVSNGALDVARRNIDRYGLRARVRVFQSDVYSALGDNRYDVVVSNPPYVSTAEVAALPREYGHEPRLGLLAGDDGLSVVRRILSGATDHLTLHGVLVVEVGDTEDTLARAYPRVPFTWLEFERGGGGVFLLTAEQLTEHRDDLGAARTE